MSAPKPSENERIAARLSHELERIRGMMDHDLVRERMRADVAEARIRVLEEDNGSLHSLLAQRDLHLARMEGYLDRVSEDDQVQAGMVEVDQPSILQPRRQGRRYFGSMGSSGGQTIGGASQAGYAETLGRRR